MTRVNNIVRAERNGYRFDARSTFESAAPQELVARAQDLALQFGGYSSVLWDPNDDKDGFLLVGDSWSALADAWAEHIGEEFIS